MVMAAAHVTAAQAKSLRDRANDQAMCVEPDFSTHRDQTLCVKHDAAALFVQLSALWLIAACRKVRLHAQRLIHQQTSAWRRPNPW